MAKVKRAYDQQTLLNDSSLKWEGFDRKSLMAFVREKLEQGLITHLRHPDVRYEVTDHCNVECIMCPRDMHLLGREHGIMSFDAYKTSLDEVTGLGCKQIVLTGFGEPLIDKQLEKKVEYAHGPGLRTYIISNGSLLTKKRATNLIQAGLDEL